MSDYMIDCATKEEWAERALRAEAKLEKAVGDLNATLQREKDANSKAMKHLRNLETEKIKTVNYGKFNHEWRREVFMLRRKLAKAVEALDEAIYMLAPDERDMEKKAGIYRIVTAYEELKGEKDE